ncbi:MAP3K12-binding inhibitory protein 1-like [Rhopilema esculentum]|uniref:MAP3K12-binding inhibitory protein 1-like n=1 Tax=Rhopilema esculentum TaxID=499914 RepID=UPI0031DC3F95
MCQSFLGTQTEDNEKGDSLVQITASSEEINRRINSFIHRKKLEVDAYNRREFCVFKSNKDESTCARTDAAFVPRHGKKSLLKTYKVYNKLDTTRAPHSKQTSSRLKGLSNAWRPTHPSTSLDLKHLPVETYERVDNLHQHVFAKPLQKPSDDENQASHSAFVKIKSLEDRVLLLEGLSPEYFSHNNKEIHYREAKDLERTWQTDFNQQTSKDAVLMDKRINELRGILQSKSNPGSVT